MLVFRGVFFKMWVTMVKKDPSPMTGSLRDEKIPESSRVVKNRVTLALGLFLSR